MSEFVKMSALGESVTEGTVSSWIDFKKDKMAHVKAYHNSKFFQLLDAPFSVFSRHFLFFKRLSY